MKALIIPFLIILFFTGCKKEEKKKPPPKVEKTQNQNQNYIKPQEKKRDIRKPPEGLNLGNARSLRGGGNSGGFFKKSKKRRF